MNTCFVCKNEARSSEELVWNENNGSIRHARCRYTGPKYRKAPKEERQYNQTLMTRPFYGSSKNGRKK